MPSTSYTLPNTLIFPISLIFFSLSFIFFPISLSFFILPLLLSTTVLSACSVFGWYLLTVKSYWMLRSILSLFSSSPSSAGYARL